MSSVLGRGKQKSFKFEDMLNPNPEGSSLLGRSYNAVPVDPNAIPVLPEIDGMVKDALMQGAPTPTVDKPVLPDVDAMVQQALMGKAPEPTPAMSPMASPEMPPAMPSQSSVAPMPKRAPAAKPEAPAAMNPVVKEYIAKKYGFGGAESDDALMRAQEGANDTRFLANMASAGNTIGSAIAGVKADNSFFDKMSEGAGQGARDLQERRKGKMDDITYGKALKDQEAEGEEENPDSSMTKTYQALASKMLPGKDFSKMTAAQIKRLVPSLEKIYQITEQGNARREMANILAGKASAKAAADKSLEGRLAKLGAEGKQRLDNAMMAHRAIRDMRAALDGGDNTFSVVGDNNFTEARRRYTEGLGRMQSGGQIGGGELRTFQDMVPGVKDKSEMQRKKLQNAELEMRQRIRTLGFDPDELDAQARGPQVSPQSQAHDIDAIDAILKERGEI